jgi:hypothetical protein
MVVFINFPHIDTGDIKMHKANDRELVYSIWTPLMKILENGIKMKCMEVQSLQSKNTRDSLNMDKEKVMQLRNFQREKSSSVSSRMISETVTESSHAQTEIYIEVNSEITGAMDTDTWNIAIILIMMVNGEMDKNMETVYLRKQQRERFKEDDMNIIRLLKLLKMMFKAFALIEPNEVIINLKSLLILER